MEIAIVAAGFTPAEAAEFRTDDFDGLPVGRLRFGAETRLYYFNLPLFHELDPRTTRYPLKIHAIYRPEGRGWARLSELPHDQAVLEAKSELEGQVAQLAALVRRRAERGEGRPTEVPRVEIELETLRAGIVRARAAADAQRQRLSTWLGAPVPRVEADLARTLQLPPLPELLQRLADGSPALRAGRARVAAAEQEASAERWDRLPKVTVGAARAEELDRQATTVTATVSVPIWNWNVGKIRQADAALAAERARLDAATRELSARAAEGWQACSAGQASAVRFREEILPRAEASAKALGRAYELGETSLLDLIDARRTLLETRTEHLDLLLDMQNACGDLAALAEMELP